ncbi:Clavaminate synthase-like protein [Athelia psychrophila]|uniref:Clavaminate synthase-like protein n=1 Tax=Athelia psychrophila TaxID=1759441 RepID=A0A167WHI2_9AGAM|nr:Clavaminate synthase-like protein [Fibularhizoctonia sp. CBS 109695]
MLASIPNAPSSKRPEGMGYANVRTESTFEQIPVIDFANASSTDPVLRRKLADEIRDASINVGFFYIKNHGISADVIFDALDAGKKFFALPEESKKHIDIHKSSAFKGYTALLGENTNSENEGDLHEGFDIGWEPEPESSSALVERNDGAMAGENVWPEGIPGFKSDVLTYYHAVVRLGQQLFPLFALALDLPENFFDDKTTKPAAIMRLLHYPPQPTRPAEKVIGIGAHTDYECFTILWQDGVGALQVMNTDGKWVDAVPIEGTFVLNLGDQFARWTNDIFKSTMHRAINKSGRERYSIPLFFGTDYDVKLEPLPGCVTVERPARYEVVTAGEYVKSRLEATYAHSKA